LRYPSRDVHIGKAEVKEKSGHPKGKKVLRFLEG
jgi:hypothetical protein